MTQPHDSRELAKNVPQQVSESLSEQTSTTFLETCRQIAPQKSQSFHLLKSREHRKLERELRDIRSEKATELILEELDIEADKALRQVRFNADETNRKLSVAHNQTVGVLLQQSAGLASAAMQQRGVEERQYQAAIANSRCSDEDKALISQLAHQLTVQEIGRIAQQHGAVQQKTTESSSVTPDATNT